MFASGAASAMPFARSRTMLALVLNRSTKRLISADDQDKCPYTITSHPGFSGDSGRDEDNICTLKGVLETVVGWFMAADFNFGIDVTNIGSNTCQVLLTGPEYD